MENTHLRRKRAPQHVRTTSDLGTLLTGKAGSNLYALELSSAFAIQSAVPQADIMTCPYPDSLSAAASTGMLWSGNSKLYLWKTNASANSLQIFDTATKQWSSESVNGDVDGLIGPGLGYVSSTGLGQSFALGSDLPGC